MNAGVTLLTYLGLVALAFAMRRHHRTVFHGDLPHGRQVVLRLTGWLTLAASLAMAYAVHGPEIGTVAWLSTVSFVGFTITLVLAYAPRCWAVLPALLLIPTCLKH